MTDKTVMTQKWQGWIRPRCGWLGAIALAVLGGMTPVALAPQGMAQPTNGLGEVVGQVYNQNGQPIAGARIRVRGSRTGTEDTGIFNRVARSDETGSFEIEGGLPGRWLMTVNHPDYESLDEEVWLFSGLTTPVDVRLAIPIRPQPRTRLGVIGVGTLAHTEFLAQRMASEVVRMGIVPNTERVLALDNRNLQPILEEIGSPLFDILEHDEIEPEDVNAFFDYLGLEAVVVARVDVLSRATAPRELTLRSRTRLELWTIDDRGEVSVRELRRETYDEVLPSDVSAAELQQVYQIQVTRMAQTIQEDWLDEDEENPLARFTEVDAEAPLPPRTTIDTTVELIIPDGGSALSDAPNFPEPLEEETPAEEEEAPEEGSPEEASTEVAE